jgi:hypothetical protein
MDSTACWYWTKNLPNPTLEKNDVIVGRGSDLSDDTKGKFLRIDLEPNHMWIECWDL